MLMETLVAALIGISFGNAWTCIFMSFGTSSENRSVGKWFILGRFLGLILLGSVISLLRFAAQDATQIILLIFGLSTIAFGFFELFRHLLKERESMDYTSKNKKRYPSNHLVYSLLSLFVVLPHKGKLRGKTHNGMGRDHFKGGEHGGKGACKRGRSLEKRSGFMLGVLRGATPCAKVVVLAPLLVVFGFPASLLLILVYAGASTIYPVIGYLSADVLSNFEKHQFKLKIAGALILVSIGVYTLMKVVTWSSIH
jgi:cytochrome c biogenesis protein CcdA